MRFMFFVMLLISTGSIAAEEPSVIETARRMNWDISIVKQFYLTGCDSGRQSEQAICTTHGFVAADMKLNDVYAKLLSELKTKESKSKLVAAQRAWIKFRDTACEFEADGYSNGKDYYTVAPGCKAEYTNERIKQLQKFVGCGGDYGCPGETF